MDEGLTVIDATKVRHVAIESGKIAEMSGWVDKATHLNLDFPDHKLVMCVIAKSLEIGAEVEFGEGGPLFAKVDPASYAHHGRVDYTQRFLDMKKALTSETGRGGEVGRRSNQRK